ncbi:MAG TPA: diacylglycerol kinase family protein [Gemmatimonadaceae bacterium]|nr:diacylglycerol kinase family protein [Gemmatimonadaceae bacterium]
MTERVAVIINPASGRGRGAKAAAAIRDAFSKVGVSDFRESTARGDERRQADRALQEGATTLVACGGDGTWSNVANAILSAGSQARLACVATGTGNDFAKTLGVPASDFPTMAKLAVEGPATLIDVGRVEQYYFVNVSGFGFDIAVIEDVESINWLKGDLVYLYSAVKQLFSYPGFQCAVNSGAGVVAKRLHLMLIIANATNFGGVFRIAPNASLTDGKLDAIGFIDSSPLQRMKLLAAVQKGTHIGHPNVIAEQAQKFVVEFDSPPAYETDGEYRRASSARLEISCVPQALRVVTPTGDRSPAAGASR